MSIEEDARTRVRDRYVVSAPLTGRLDRIALREGDTVAEGAAIARLEPALSPMLDDRTQRDLQLQLQIARAGAQEAGARLERAEVARRQAASQAQRSAQLATQGFVAPTRLESDQLALLAAQDELHAAGSALRAAQFGVEQARAALVAVRQPATGGRRSFVLRAPVGGAVLRVLQASEGHVALGTPVVEVGDTRRLEVVAELLTTDALQALPGRRVVIERWGGPAKVEGRVRRVEPAAFTKVSALGVEEQRVRVLIDPTAEDRAPAEWRAVGDGFRVGVRIVTLSEPAAVKVPVSAVFPTARDGGASQAVFTVEEGVARQRIVELGGRNGSEAWVRSGLAAGSVVVVYPPAGLQPGQRVQARPAD
ncbi:MAG: HlyD family efflux transporter periplasmic adaptor subunit [Aquabacterium sp.]|nr:MAG: HlyD family efflux transporter periplasmic adaptor subunit [Aquabacterium sp.]